jgi:glycosyltransferase involved in cell wall biosynthesis
MLEQLASLYYVSKNPYIVRCRKFLQKYPVVLEGVRTVFFAIRLIRAWNDRLHDWIWPPINPVVRAVLATRRTNGPLVAGDVVALWALATGCKRILCIGVGPELEQTLAILRCRGIRSIETHDIDYVLNVESISRKTFDLITITVQGTDPQKIAKVEALFPGARLFLAPTTPMPTKEPSARLSLRDKLAAGKPLSILMLNDVGFQYGAGTAHRRQAESFLMNGWIVSAMAWMPGPEVSLPSVPSDDVAGSWAGMDDLSYLSSRRGVSDDAIIAKIVQKVRSVDPDIILIGNYHGSAWPLSLLSHLKELGPFVVAYMHDTYWVTGRCAQPLSCTMFRTGCNSSCPTPDENPKLAPSKIASAWKERAGFFTGASAIPLIANSRWTRDIVIQRFGSAARTDVVHLGIDHYLFAPLDKADARRLLGIQPDKTMIVMGAVDVTDRWKGGPIFQAVRRSLLERPDVGVMLFGRASETVESTKSFGFVRDEGLMALILNAADIFVSTAIAESFGQTLLEASSCGLPVVALDVGGITDIVEHGKTGLLAEQPTAAGMISAIDLLIENPQMRAELGKNARTKVEREFTLARQGEAWIDCLRKMC